MANMQSKSLSSKTPGVNLNIQSVQQLQDGAGAMSQAKLFGDRTGYSPNRKASQLILPNINESINFQGNTSLISSKLQPSSAMAKTPSK